VLQFVLRDRVSLSKINNPSRNTYSQNKSPTSTVGLLPLDGLAFQRQAVRLPL